MQKTQSKTVDIQHIASAPQWTCTHFGRHSEIEAFISTTGQWETIADVRSVGNVDAEDLADFIISALRMHNSHQ